MYLRDIVKAESGTEAFVESIKQDFVLSNRDLPILTELARQYNRETSKEAGNYFIHAATFINKVANTLTRLGVSKEAAEDFRSLTPVYQEFYNLKDKNNYDILLIDKTRNEFNGIVQKLLQHYDFSYEGESKIYKKNVVKEIKSTVYWTYSEFHILTANMFNHDMFASHCMSAAADDIYDALKQEFFKYS